jgi:N-methylhydantoinase A
LLGGRMNLDESAAREAITNRVAAPLGLEPVAAALGIIRIINSTMAYAIRAITVQRGLDPGDFALLAFGGAGPMHGCEVAAELGISRIIVPVASGAFSALGMLLGDVRHDLVRTRLQPLDEADPALISSLLAELQSEATALMRDELPPDAPIAFERSLDIRYVGQEYTVKVPIMADTVTADDLPRLRAEFDRRHEQAYGHASATERTEMINVRLTALGALRPPNLRAIPIGSEEPSDGALIGQGETCFDHNVGNIPAPRYERSALLAGNRITGPALISEDGATTVLTPECSATVDPVGNLIIEREASS